MPKFAYTLLTEHAASIATNPTLIAVYANILAHKHSDLQEDSDEAYLSAMLTELRAEWGYRFNLNFYSLQCSTTLHSLEERESFHLLLSADTELDISPKAH